ncbi:MAG: AAA family ATPase [Gammaproteobacteria bacterium]|nr:AAA family ATPase [Gammaproteobacteria bacterium]
MTDALHNLVKALQQPALFPHPVTRFAVVETHISIVLLTGTYAYKFKKPVNFGFLDFSTLAKRKHFCAEELRLNRRLAPELYLEVVPVSAGPHLGADGDVIECAVRMREFEQASQFDRMLDEDRLTPAHIDALAVRIAEFHATATVAEPESTYGLPATVQAPVDENFSQVLEHIQGAQEHSRVSPVQDWAQRTYSGLRPVLQARKDSGFIRECHGDLHLRNIALVDDVPVAFDCIEFNDKLRWIDIISEVAFMVMDLDHRGRPDLASRFLNAWLEHSGDYAGLSLLRYYLVYRAMVRAKVDCLRAHQPDVDTGAQAKILQDYHAYIELAGRYTKARPPALLLMHGLSGSGKTTVSQFLLEKLPAIRMRSDVERKRLHGFAGNARTGAGVDQGIYARNANARTYRQLALLAGKVLDAGHNVIIDAAFLQQAQRTPFIELAHARATRCFIIDCQAPEAELRQRITVRQHGRQDASEASVEVLENQLRHYQPLDSSATGAEILVTDSDAKAMARLVTLLQQQLQ